MDELKSVRSETDRESERSYIIGLKSGRKFFVPVYSWTVSDRRIPTSGLLFSQLMIFLQNESDFMTKSRCAMS